MKQISTGAGLVALGVCVVLASAFALTERPTFAVAAANLQQPKAVFAWQATKQEGLEGTYLLSSDGGIWVYDESLVEDPKGEFTGAQIRAEILKVISGAITLSDRGVLSMTGAAKLSDANIQPGKRYLIKRWRRTYSLGD